MRDGESKPASPSRTRAARSSRAAITAPGWMRPPPTDPSSIVGSRRPRTRARSPGRATATGFSRTFSPKRSRITALEIAEAVDEAEPLRLGAGPDRAGEKGRDRLRAPGRGGP